MQLINEVPAYPSYQQAAPSLYPQFAVPQVVSAAGAPHQAEKPKPYVSKFQKLASMLNETEPAAFEPPRTFAAPKQAPEVPKLISYIDADPSTLTS